MDGVEGDKLEAELQRVLYVGSQAKDKGNPQLEKTLPSSPQPLGTEKEAHALSGLLEGLLGCVFLHPAAEVSQAALPALCKAGRRTRK